MIQDALPTSRSVTMTDHADVATPPSQLEVMRGLATSIRPRQWIKNGLVFTAPAAAATLHRPDVLIPSLGAFAAFCLVASGSYCLNDVRDAAADRAHPLKRHRPIAAGVVSPRLARGAGLALLLCGMALAGSIGVGLLLIVAAYVGLTTAYTYVLKDVPVLDIAAISVGFVLRALAGGVASGLPVTDWFIIVISFGALFLAAGKRFSELATLGPDSGTRPSLAAYSQPFLRSVTFAALTITILAYCAWVFDQPGDAPWLTASVLPLVLALLRYGLLIEQGAGEAPDRVVVNDRALQVLGLLWAGAFLPGVYL